jgi:hypothetical protein
MATLPLFINRSLSPLIALVLDAMDNALITPSPNGVMRSFEGLPLENLYAALRSKGEWDMIQELRAAVEAYEGLNPYKNWKKSVAVSSMVMNYGGTTIELIHCLGGFWKAYLNVPIFYAYGADGKGRMQHTVEAEGLTALAAAKNAARSYSSMIAARVGVSR